MSGKKFTINAQKESPKAKALEELVGPANRFMVVSGKRVFLVWDFESEEDYDAAWVLTFDQSVVIQGMEETRRRL